MTLPRGKLDCHGATDVGRMRRTNEDHFLVAGLNRSMLVHQTSLGIEDPTRLFGGTQGHLLVVADGMGGHRSGEVASSTAVDSLTHYLLNTMPWFFRLDLGEVEELRDELKEALRACQEEIHRIADGSPDREGMGSTLTMGYVTWPRLFVVHVGDSRCYLLRGGRLERITCDHTIAQTMVEEGRLDPEEAESSKWSHVLWNALGGSSDRVSPDVYGATLELGDTILLCTDGLTKHLDDARIAETLQAAETAEDACRRLIDGANAAGGEDNVTVIVARFVEPDDVPRTAGEAAAAEYPEAGKRATEERGETAAAAG